MQLGDFEITAVTDGHFRLDGGSMFGIVPRVLWEKKIAPDDQHRIRLAVRCLLVRNGKRTLLIDAGLGNKFSDEFRNRYAVEQPVTLIENLQTAGVRPEDVTDVINCHLHFDHAGWNTIWKDSRIVPTFPNARYWSQRGEWERARDHAAQRDRASFVPDDFLPLERKHFVGHPALAWSAWVTCPGACSRAEHWVYLPTVQLLSVSVIRSRAKRHFAGPAALAWSD